MPKLLDQPVKVSGHPLPHSFYWRGQQYEVYEILDQWRDTGCWWQGEKEKFFIRTLLTDKSIVELYYQEDTWSIYKTYD